MEISNDKGNRIYKDGLRIYLQLATEARPRLIGTLEGDTLYVKRNRAKHLHRKSNSYGFNYMLINEMESIKKVSLTDEHGTYEIPREVIEAGKLMNFSHSQDGNRYELQYFVPLTKIEDLEMVESYF